jgi:hypothetical protein
LETKILAVASQQRTVSHFLFHQGTFDQKQHYCRPSTNLLAWLSPLRRFSVSPIEDKTDRQFDTIDVIEAESQVSLNLLREHYFQDADALGTVHMGGRMTVTVAGRSEVSF